MRTNRMQSKSSNPATKFISWKSTHKSFAYYDKDQKTDILIELPFKFLAMASYITVRGWNQKKEYSLIANEVKSINDELVVNAYSKDKGKMEIARGAWSEIREKCEFNGGKYTQSVYAMLENGEIANIRLNGSGLQCWFNFQKGQSHLFFNHWVEVKQVGQGSKGSVTFNYPIFEFGGIIDAANEANAEKCDNLIQQYETVYFGQPESVVDKYFKDTPPAEETNTIAISDSAPGFLNPYNAISIGPNAGASEQPKFAEQPGMPEELKNDPMPWD